MKVYDLDYNISTLSLTGYTVDNGDQRPRSELHLETRKILKEFYSTTIVLEEVTINIKRGSVSYLDFFIPQHKLCIEVHGRQHFEFCQFYHKNQAGFLQHKKRDRDKRLWLEINNIKLIELNYNESTTEWRAKLTGSKPPG